MIEYVLRYDGEDIQACDCCGCEVPTYPFDKPWHQLSEAGRARITGRTVSSPPREREDQFLYCEVCSSTLISGIHNFPDLYREESHMLTCIAQCTNMILQEIRKGRK